METIKSLTIGDSGRAGFTMFVIFDVLPTTKSVAAIKQEVSRGMPWTRHERGIPAAEFMSLNELRERGVTHHIGIANDNGTIVREKG